MWRRLQKNWIILDLNWNAYLFKMNLIQEIQALRELVLFPYKLP